MLVTKPQPRGESTLVIEQQALLGASGLQVQRVAISTQGGLGFLQRLEFGRIQQAGFGHVRQVRCTRQALPDPAQRIERAQTARPVLYIGLEVIGRVVEASVTRITFSQARGQVRIRRPQRRVFHDRSQAFIERGVAGQATGIKQAGEHTHIVSRQRAALRRITHGAAHFQADVPKCCEELFQRPQAWRIRRFDQRQQVHIRGGKQQATAKSADGEQRGAGHLTETAFPHVRHHPTDRFAAPARQCGGVGTIPERFGQASVHVTQQLTQRAPGIAGNP